MCEGGTHLVPSGTFGKDDGVSQLCGGEAVVT